MAGGSDRELRTFGVFLRSLREANGLSLGQVVQQLRRQKPPVRLSTSTLSRYECGEVRDPPVGLLRACASLFGIGFNQIVVALVRDKYGVDLGSAAAASTAGAAHEATAPYLTRLAEMEVFIHRLTPEGVRVVDAVLRGLASEPGYVLPPQSRVQPSK